MKLKALQDFELHSEVPGEVIAKYEGKIPGQFVEIWKDCGLGTFMQGYFKVINPDDYIEFVRESYFEKNCIPLLITALGDIIVWERNEFIYILLYRYNDFDGIAKGCKYFFDDLEDKEFIEDCIKPKNFKEALQRLGKPAYDECYGYVPLLSLGGSEKPGNLQKVKLREHLELMYQMQGGI